MGKLLSKHKSKKPVAVTNTSIAVTHLQDKYIPHIAVYRAEGEKVPVCPVTSSEEDTSDVTGEGREPKPVLCSDSEG